MRNYKYFLPLLFIVIAMSLLEACSISVSKPDSNLSPIYSIETSVMLTVSATPVSSPTLAPTSTPSITHTPSPTPTLFFSSTATPTLQWSACPGIVITKTNNRKGDKLHILRCEDGLEYDLGPLAKGVYAVGPEDKFFVYITVGGIIYAAKIGDPTLNKLYDLGREQIFGINKRVTPDFKISFSGEGPIYRLVLVERNYDQKRVYELPMRDHSVDGYSYKRSVFIIGFVVVVITFFPLSTFVLTRAARSQLNWVVFGVMRRIFEFILRFTSTYEQRDQIMAYYSPISLIMLVPVWYALIMMGYAAIYWSLGVGERFADIRFSGSSLLTLGFATSDFYLRLSCLFQKH